MPAAAKSIRMNKGGKNYIILPTLVDTSASTSNDAATTSVFCPYKVYGAHNGYKSVSNGTGEEGFFQEIVGVVPCGIISYHTGEKITLTENNLTAFVDKIRYTYLSDGHKVISIIYNQSGFSDKILREIEFKILFEDGDYHTVRQQVISTMCLDSDQGLAINTDEIFKSTYNSDGLENPTSPGTARRHQISIDNISADKGIMSFHTQSYTDPKWNGENEKGQLSPSANNLDFFELIYLPLGILDYNFPTPQALALNQSATGDSGTVHTFAPRFNLYSVRQITPFQSYDYNSATGVTGGNLNEPIIDPINQYVHDPSTLGVSGSKISDSCYRSLEFLTAVNSHMSQDNGVFSVNNTQSGTVFIFDPAITEIRNRSLAAGDDGELLGGPRGLCGSGPETDKTDKRKVSAFYVDGSRNLRKTQSTARRIDTVMYGIRNKNGSSYSNNAFNAVDGGYDTTSGFLKDIARGMMRGAGKAGQVSGYVSTSVGARGSVSYTSIEQQDQSAEGLVDCNIISPSDLISNFIFGEHTFYLGRPHHSSAINSLQGKYQSSLIAAAFRKHDHPDYTTPADLTECKPSLGGINVVFNDFDVMITAVPMHTYVDSFNAFTLTDLTGSIQQAQFSGLQNGFTVVEEQEGSSGTNGDLSTIRQDIKPFGTGSTIAFSIFKPLSSANGTQSIDTVIGKPSLDKNSVRYSGSGLTEPMTALNNSNLLGLLDSSPASVAANSISAATGNTEFTFLGVPHAETKAYVTNGGESRANYSSDSLLSYVRGCINMPRGETLNTSNYQLDLLLDPLLSNTDVEFTELQFTAKYNTGTGALVSDNLFNIFGGLSLINCGCGGNDNGDANVSTLISNLQFLTSGNSPISDNALDIFSIKYTPGRHPEPLFPINTEEFSSGTEVTTLLGSPTGSNHIAELTVNMDNEDPFAQDRPLVDVQLDSFQWDEDYKPVSRIELSQRDGVTSPQIGIEPATDVSGTNLDYSSQKFEFVSLGKEVLEGGGVEEDLPGCTDPTAINYDSAATVDNDSCVYCTLEAGWEDFFRTGLSGSSTILPQPGITDGSAGFGMGPFYNNTEYLNGEWHIGQIGNAHNHWGYGLTAALDSAGAIAVPYGEGFGDDANPYTEFKFTATFAPYQVTDIPGFQIFVQSLIDEGSFEADAYTMSFFDIDQWTGEDGWQDTYTPDTLPISGDPIGTMSNQGDSALDIQFASYSIADNSNGFVPNTTDPLTDGFGQSFLRPGKHYVAVLNVSVGAATSGYTDPNTGKPVDCNIELRFPFNFWVTFCGCDIPTAPNYIGEILEGSYPWLANDISFPAGYELIDQCKVAGSRIKRSDAESAGYCLPLPDPFTCENFIDACIQSTSAECVESDNGLGQQDFVGTITVDVYGAYTSNNDGDQYSFILGSNNELFTFNLYLIEATTWNGTVPDPEEGFFFSFQSEADYADFGFNPFTDNALILTFDNLPQGTYIAIIEQTNQFVFQENPCGAQQVGVPVTLSVGGDTDCPDFIVGCTDPSATNYNAEAVFDDGSCEFIECEDVFLTGKITEVTSTNSTIACIQVDIDDSTENEVLVNTLVDQQTGSLTISGFVDDITGQVSGTFVAGFCQAFDGNSGQAVTQLLDLFASSQNEFIINTTRTDLVPITLNNGQTIGGFLPFDGNGNPVLSTEGIQGLFAGFYAVMLIPAFVAEQDFEECATEIVSNFDSIAFKTVGSTFDFTDCPTPCNDQTESEDCPDHIGGCTDENASNYNPDATFDDGTCNNGGQSECDQNPDDPDCVDCDTAASSGLRTFRNCDEFNETTEGCCDPLACNYDPTVDVCLASRCEYCCDGLDDCIDDPGQDECEDANGNVLPDCVQPDCPDPSNPDCDTPIVDPCPGGDCGQPPEAECVILGTCEDIDNPTDPGDPVVIFDDYEIEVSCTPDGLGTYSTFSEVQSAAMTCSANEGSKLLFKIKSGVKHDRTDLIKLTLINYLFNFAMNEPCMANCDEVTNEQARLRGIERSTCQEKWRGSGSEVWTPTSTYGKGMTVAVIKFLAGELRKSYYTSTSPVGAGDVPPYASIANKKVSKWTRCLDVRGKSSNNPGEPAYVYKFFEFMQKYCQQCFVGEADPVNVADARRQPTRPVEPTGLIDENGNEIKLF